ncbi:ribosomal protein S8 [Xylariaceae sp. FL0594]|nr:ribosomal protein S8 [Xylariaceae sp. FL0594]
MCRLRCLPCHIDQSNHLPVLQRWIFQHSCCRRRCNSSLPSNFPVRASPSPKSHHRKIARRESQPQKLVVLTSSVLFSQGGSTASRSNYKPHDGSFVLGTEEIPRYPRNRSIQLGNIGITGPIGHILAAETILYLLAPPPPISRSLVRKTRHTAVKMGIHSICNMAAHLSNASKASLGLTSIPHNKYNLSVALALHRAGFLSFVTRGGPHPPDPATVATFEPEPLTTANAARQRIWVGLKYVNNKPVLRRVQPISTPSRRICADLKSLERLCRGFDASYQKGLNIGECMFVSTDRGTLEIREAVERRVGGTLLCRAGP